MSNKDFLYKAFIDSMAGVSKVNTSDETIEFIKNPADRVVLGKKYDYRKYIDKAFGIGQVLDEDVHKFEVMKNFELFKKKCENNEGGEIVSYRKIKDGSIHWARIFLYIPDDYSKDNPYVLLARRDLYDGESEDQNILSTVGEKTNKIIASNTNQRTSNITTVMGEKVDISIILSQFSLSFIGNLLSVMSFFIRRYMEFFVVDLEKDNYVALKIEKDIVEGKIPLVGNYSGNVLPSMKEKYGEEAELIFKDLDTPEKIRKLLKNKLSIQNTFVDRNGEELIVYITKIESSKEKPTKVLIRISHFSSGEKLKVKTFGNFEVYDLNGNPLKFTRNKSKQVLAYLIDKHGYKVSTRDIVVDVLEKDEDDSNAIKYVSTLIKGAISDLNKAGFSNIISKEWNSFSVDVNEIDCDYYRFLNGDMSELNNYHNEYMKEYSWAEETNGEIMNYDL